MIEGLDKGEKKSFRSHEGVHVGGKHMGTELPGAELFESQNYRSDTALTSP